MNEFLHRIEIHLTESHVFNIIIFIPFKMSTQKELKRSQTARQARREFGHSLRTFRTLDHVRIPNSLFTLKEHRQLIIDKMQLIECESECGDFGWWPIVFSDPQWHWLFFRCPLIRPLMNHSAHNVLYLV